MKIKDKAQMGFEGRNGPPKSVTVSELELKANLKVKDKAQMGFEGGSEQPGP